MNKKSHEQKGKRGRRKNAHEGMFSEWQINYALEILKHLHEKKNKSLRFLTNCINEYGQKSFEKVKKDYEHIQVNEDDFKVSVNTFKNDIQPTRDLKKQRMNAYYIWVREYAFKNFEIDLPEEYTTNRKIPLEVERICDVFGINKSKVNVDLHLLDGTYCLYRPCHENPKTMVALAKLTIDSTKGGFCTYHSKRMKNIILGAGKSEEIDETIADGFIAFEEKRFFMVLKNEQKLPMIIIADEIKIPYDAAKVYSEFGGIIAPMLAPSVSAWSFCAKRLNEEQIKKFKPLTIPYTNKEDFPDMYRTVREYGFINWRNLND